jgi:hypothetical protein
VLEDIVQKRAYKDEQLAEIFHFHLMQNAHLDLTYLQLIIEHIYNELSS